MENMLTNPLFYGMVIVTLSGILGIFGLILSIYALIEVKALKNSTHSVQYMPIDPQVDKENADFMKEWATSDEAVEKQNKLFTEDLEEKLPSFLPDDEDKKTYSF